MKTICTHTNPLHWHNLGTSTGELIPLDENDANGTAFQFGSTTCENVYATTTASTTEIFPTFTYGEIVLTTLSFFTFSIILCSVILLYMKSKQ
jgi:hypothetical protein